jgi:hypothetical protein
LNVLRTNEIRTYFCPRVRPAKRMSATLSLFSVSINQSENNFSENKLSKKVFREQNSHSCLMKFVRNKVSKITLNSKTQFQDLFKLCLTSLTFSLSRKKKLTYFYKIKRSQKLYRKSLNRTCRWTPVTSFQRWNHKRSN